MSPTVHQPTRARAAGFTLIEVLVVMIMLTLISGILFQALERAYRLQERFGATLFSVQQGQMASDWYRQTVHGLYPDFADGAHIFAGKPQEFAGLSSNPLNADYGIPTPIMWRLRSHTLSDTTDLVYVDKQQETVILSWQGQQAKFSYIDSQNTAHDQWPPSLGLFDQLPSQIQVQTPQDAKSITLIASPMGPTTPPLRLKDILGLPQ